LLGSANVTKRGIGEMPIKYNYELNTINQATFFLDLLYFDKIISESEYVTDELFEQIKRRVESLGDYKKQEELYQNTQMETIKKQSDFFLMSELPMFEHIEILYDATKNQGKLSSLEKKCISHDISTYQLDYLMPESEFYFDLKEKFNNHPFILDLKKSVKNDPRQSFGYGKVVEWIKTNTTTVPTPISWQLKEKQVINILLKWITFFDSDYVVERPNYSEVLFYRKSI
jgi:hypothetical protein